MIVEFFIQSKDLNHNHSLQKYEHHSRNVIVVKVTNQIILLNLFNSFQLFAQRRSWQSSVERSLRVTGIFCAPIAHLYSLRLNCCNLISLFCESFIVSQCFRRSKFSESIESTLRWVFVLVFYLQFYGFYLMRIWLDHCASTCSAYVENSIPISANWKFNTIWVSSTFHPYLDANAQDSVLSTKENLLITFSVYSPKKSGFSYWLAGWFYA